MQAYIRMQYFVSPYRFIAIVFLFVICTIPVNGLSQVKSMPGNSEQPKKSLVNDQVSNSGKKFDLEMVYVEGGTFTMGCSAKKLSDCFSDELPAHKVTVNGFYMGKFEITQLQWRIVMGSNPQELNFKGCDNCPVERISWKDALEFIGKLNQLTGKNYRLPTEAEWEFAARGGNKSKSFVYAGSNNADEVAWFKTNSSGRTHSKGGNKPNELGIFDMSGNVWEWCQDWYDEGFYSLSAAQNPVNVKEAKYKVLRGSCWMAGKETLFVWKRYKNTPEDRGYYSGLRIVKDE